jgi:glycerol-1-phosphate dehydrogenase [NAD(P)+]
MRTGFDPAVRLVEREYVTNPPRMKTSTPNLPRAGKYFRASVASSAAIFSGNGFLSGFLGAAREPFVLLGDANTLAAFERIGVRPQSNDVVVNLGAPLRLDDPLVERALPQIPRGLDHLVVVGGGTLNDLGKLIAHELGSRLTLVASCASMNGWISPNASIVRGGNKISVAAVAPAQVLLDDALLGAAPGDLTAAGFSDALSGLFACRDWLLAAHADLATYDADVAEGVQRSLAPLAAALDADGFDASSILAALIDALLAGGLAMDAAHTSAPASGAEHLVAHAIDLHELAQGLPPTLHGHAVAAGSLLVAALWDVIVEGRFGLPMPLSADARITALCTWLPTMTEAAPSIVRAKLTREATRPPAVDLAALASAAPELPRVERLRGWLSCAGAPTTAASLGLDRAFFKTALLCARDLRDRYTVFDLAFALGVLPARADDVLTRSGLFAECI